MYALTQITTSRDLENLKIYRSPNQQTCDDFLGATVKITQDNRNAVSMLIKGSSVLTKVGDAEYRTVVALDGSVSSATPWGHVVSTDTVPYTVLADRDPMLGESFPVPAKQKTEVSGEAIARLLCTGLFKSKSKHNIM